MKKEQQSKESVEGRTGNYTLYQLAQFGVEAKKENEDVNGVILLFLTMIRELDMGYFTLIHPRDVQTPYVQ